MDGFEFLAYMVEQEHKALNSILDKITSEDELNADLLPGRDKISIGDRLAHIISAEYRMATYLYQKESDITDFKVDSTSLDEIKEKSIISKQRHLLTLKNLTTDDFDKVWTSKVSGNSYDYKYLLWHFIEHIATHRGQVAMALNRDN